MNTSNRLGLRTLAGYVILFIAIWILNMIFGVGVRSILKIFTDSPNIRSFVGSTLNFGGRLVAIVLLSTFALKWLLRINPWAVMFPFRTGWWKDLLFGFALAAAIILNLTADSAYVVAAVTTQRGLVWFVGRGYGVELGAAGILGMGFILAGMWLWARKHHQPYPALDMHRPSTGDILYDKN